MSLWTGGSPERAGKVSSLQMCWQTSMWTSKPVWVMSVERKCPCGRFDVGPVVDWKRSCGRLSQCVLCQWKKTSPWTGSPEAAREERKCHCRQVSPCGL